MRIAHSGLDIQNLATDVATNEAIDHSTSALAPSMTLQKVDTRIGAKPLARPWLIHESL
jgi:hypothetical protein